MKPASARPRAVVAHFDARWQHPETLQAIFNQISDAIFFYDKNLRLIRVNSSAEKLFGLPGEALLGKGCWDLFGAAVFESGQDIPPGDGQPWSLPTGTIRLRVNGGRERRLIIRNIELLDAAGELEGVVATAAEIPDSPHSGPVEILDEAPSSVSGRDPRTDGHGTPSPGHFVPGQSSPGNSSYDKHRRIVQRNRIVAFMVGTFFLLVVVLFGVSKLMGPGGRQLTGEEKQRREKREAAARFNAMTPAQHIEQAKLALSAGATPAVIEDGLLHLKVIPSSAPESGGAKVLERELINAQNVANAQSLIDSSSSGDLREGMGKLQRATAIIDKMSRQYPALPEVAQLTRAVQTATEQMVVRYPQEFAAAETKLVSFNWQKGGFGTVMIANFTVRNESSVDLADVKFRCEHYSADGVVLDQNTASSYVTIKAHSTTRIPNVNMGFLNSESGNIRTTRTDCEIVSLRLASESHASGSMR